MVMVIDNFQILRRGGWPRVRLEDSKRMLGEVDNDSGANKQYWIRNI